MESIQYLYELMEKDCSIAVLGYGIEHEKLKDEFISRLNHHKIEKMSSSFDVLSIIRDIKLKSVLDNSHDFDWIILDTNDIILDKSDDYIISKSKEIRLILEKFRTEIHKRFEEDNKTEFGLDFDDPLSHQPIEFKPNFRLLVTTPIHRTRLSKDVVAQKFSSGDSTIYISDLVFHFETGTKSPSSTATSTPSGKLLNTPYIKIVKNRMGSEVDINIDDIVKTVNRERKISTILK